MSEIITYGRTIILALAIVPLGCKRQKTVPDTIWVEPLTKMEFVKIQKGSFTMGDNSLDGPTNHSIAHKVVLESDFWMGTTEVTQQQWQVIMGSEEPHPDKPSPFRNRYTNYPIVSVSYDDVQKFIDKLNEQAHDSRFRLPTEAEWEYACRAATTAKYHFGDTLSDQMANYNASIASSQSLLGQYIGHPTPVGRYSANAWGLYDMHGNVWEWVSDWYAPYPDGPVTNPTGPEKGSLKIIRGGSWYFGAENAQSDFRKTHRPELWGFSIGFRLVREVGSEERRD